MSLAVKIENLSKQYRLGQVGTGTLAHDLNRWWAQVRGKEDPFLKIGEKNVRHTIGNEPYVWALEDVNLEVKEGEVMGVVGKNGAGKSTLLKILSRVTGPTTGMIKAKGRIASLLEVGTGFHSELTGRENVYLNGAILGMTKAEVTSKLDEIVSFAGVERYLDTPVKRYSSGMKVRLGFAVAAHLEPEILVVDEVLAVGDAEFQRKCIGKMHDVARTGRTILFVSHNMGSVTELCDRAILLEDGQKVFEGTSSEVVSQYLRAAGENNNPVVFEGKQHVPFTLQSISILNEKGKVSSNFDFTEDVVIRVDLVAREPLEKFYLNLQLYKGPDLLFFTRHSDEEPDLISLGNGSYRFRYTIPGNVLKADGYSINLIGTYKGGVAGNGYREVYENVIRFEVGEISRNLENTGYSRNRKGMVIGPGKWQVENVSEARTV